MTTILRKYHSVARCTLLGEMIEDTAHRYYYRPHVGGELTFADKESPAIHLTPCPAARTGPPANNAAAPSGRTRDDIDPRRRRPGSGSADRLVARRLVGRDHWASGQLMSVVGEPHLAERRFLSVLSSEGIRRDETIDHADDCCCPGRRSPCTGIGPAARRAFGPGQRQLGPTSGHQPDHAALTR
jgi:hypothetical protein